MNFYIEDESGRRSGKLANGTEVADIPGTRGRYGTDSMDDLVGNQAGPEAVEFHTSSFPSGRFNLVLVPATTTPYWMNFSVINENRTRIDRVFNGFAVAGTSITFVFEHHPATDAPKPILKVVTVPSLRQSAQAALQVNQLGDAKFVAKLDKILAEAEKAASKGKKKDAVEKLREFIKKLEKAAKGEKDDDDDKHEKPEHRHGKDEKRFVSAQALASLREDALTLIAQLQPRDHHDDGKKHDHDDHDKKGDDR